MIFHYYPLYQISIIQISSKKLLLSKKDLLVAIDNYLYLYEIHLSIYFYMMNTIKLLDKGKGRIWTMESRE